MSADYVYAGIDVSKKTLQLAIRLDGSFTCSQSFPNTTAGIGRLVNKITKTGRPSRAVLEPTSRHHVPLLLALAETPDCAAMSVNPWRARRFQDSRGKRAKTDPLDAQGLARMAEQLADEFIPYTPPPDVIRQLQMLGRLLAVYVNQRAKAKCRRSSYRADDPLVQDILASLEREIAFCQGEVDHLTQLMLGLVKPDPELYRSFQWLTQIGGIATQSALQLLGELLVFPSDMGPRQWVSCAGLDPRPRQSGQSNPPMHISRMGNRYLKQVLYMAAMTTTKYEPQIKAYYQQFHARKGSKRLAQVVVMRRLLHGIWWMLHKQQPFDAAKCFPIPTA